MSIRLGKPRCASGFGGSGETGKFIQQDSWLLVHIQKTAKYTFSCAR